MSSWSLSPPHNSAAYSTHSRSSFSSLSPPSYSVQEDPSSGDLRSRAQQLWPDRPEFGRYSLGYEYLDQKRIETKRKKHERKRKQLFESEPHISRVRAEGGSPCTSARPVSDIIVPFNCITDESECEIHHESSTSSEQLVRTSMLFSSSSGLANTASRQTATTDDLLTLGGILPTRSPDLVPSELLRSSCSVLRSRSIADSLSTYPPPSDGEDLLQNTAYHFLGAASDQEALLALKSHPFVVYLKKGSSEKLQVAFHVAGEAHMFPVELLNIKEGGALWRITGTTYCLGFRTLEEMARFYKQFPLTAE